MKKLIFEISGTSSIIVKWFPALWFIFLCQMSACHSPSESLSDDPKTYLPDQDLGLLFDTVQTSGIFSDYKTFVDCIPKREPTDIVQDFERLKNGKAFNLKAFVLDNFDLPPAVPEKEIDRQSNMIDHLKGHWSYLTRTSQSDALYTTLISLPYPFVVPGGRFREMFYWDSYFSMIGLMESGEEKLAYGMLKNFEFLIDSLGFIPNGNRTYFASRSQPPFFAEMLALYSEKKGMDAVLAFLPALEKEYQFWNKDNGTVLGQNKAIGRSVGFNGVVLNRYYGSLPTPRAEGYGKEKRWASVLPESERAAFHIHLRTVCESGWDFSSRWFADGKTKITAQGANVVPVCLNSLLFNMELQLAKLYDHRGEKEKANKYQTLAQERRAAMQQMFWLEEAGYFMDFDWVKEEPTRVLSLATLYPLYFGVADSAQAAQVADVVRQQLLYDGGVVSSTLATGEQWDYPNGWAPLQWITVKGLAKYGHMDLAKTIARRWLQLNEKVFRTEGKMMEKYNVVDTSLVGGGGEYPNQDGFGWTNGVALGLDVFLKE